MQAQTRNSSCAIRELHHLIQLPLLIESRPGRNRDLTLRTRQIGQSCGTFPFSPLPPTFAKLFFCRHSQCLVGPRRLDGWERRFYSLHRLLLIVLRTFLKIFRAMQLNVFWGDCFGPRHPCNLMVQPLNEKCFRLGNTTTGKNSEQDSQT